MKPLDPRTEVDQLRRLRRMKTIPLILLGLMALLFIATLGRPEPWAPWVHAFAEAGMVGALADWFAVVALFRHPLGLPIPHTAIIPQRKDELGDALARFVAEHFLEPEVVRAKLTSVELSRRAAEWLATESGRERVLDALTAAARWGLGALEERQVRALIGRLSRRQLESLELSALAGTTLEWLVAGDRHRGVVTQLLRVGVVVLHENGSHIRARIREESPWWLPGFIDDRIVEKMIQRVSSLLLEMSLDEEHEIRRQWDEGLQRLALDLRDDPAYHQLGERLKRQLLDNEVLQDYLYSLWTGLVERLDDDLAAPDSRIRAEVGRALRHAAGELQADHELRYWLDQWLIDAGVALVAHNRDGIASLISDTVQTWDSADTSRRVELAIGRDLQFIRINGTLVGGLVGVVLHALTTTLG